MRFNLPAGLRGLWPFFFLLLFLLSQEEKEGGALRRSAFRSATERSEALGAEMAAAQIGIKGLATPAGRPALEKATLP